MVIGFDGSRAFTSERTGTENYSYQLLKALAKVDKKNDYIVYIRSNSVILSGVPEGEKGLKWPENFHFKYLKWPRLWTQGGLALHSFKDKLDILFVPAHTLPIIRKPGLKTVITVHDLGSEYLPSMHQLKQRAYLSFMQKVQLRGATKLIAVSYATKEDLVKRAGVESEKVEVIYEGYDKKLFKSVTNDTLVNSLIPYFLFVGTVQPRKNLERVIKAFSIFLSLRGAEATKQSNKQSLRADALKKIATLPAVARNDGINLVIVGSKGWMSDEIYKLPKKLGIEDKVKFLGYVPDEKLPTLYSGAQALVFPSLFEGFGLPILEAQACGCPVITSDVSSMPEVAGDGAIFVDPCDVEQMVNAMIRVKDERESLKLIKKGSENIKKFSWEKCARETLKVLEAL